MLRSATDFVVMSGLRRRYCVFGCDISLSHGVPLHRFPNPDKRPDIFAVWVSCVGDILTEHNSQKIYKNKRVCDHHFKLAHKTTGGRLIASAIPTTLKRVSCSLAAIAESDHNYCRPRREYHIRPMAEYKENRAHIVRNIDKLVDSRPLQTGNATGFVFTEAIIIACFLD